MTSDVIFEFGEHKVARDGGLFFMFEMANNHQGSLDHGLKIIQAMAGIVRSRKITAGIKFQFRNLTSLLHPGFLNSCLPASSNKHSRRFVETRLTFEDFATMVKVARENDMIPFATPFDEPSVDWCESLNLPVIKVASCSATDWPLLRRIAQSKRPVICSTAGLSLRQIDDVVGFFRQRTLPLAIMHCVGIYPPPRQHLQLDQIRQLRNRYPELVIGYSAHESAADLDTVALAVSSGAALLERHVGVATEMITLNSYSLGPAEAAAWVACALSAHTALSPGQPRIQHEVEKKSLDELKRGIYTRVNKTPGGFLQPDDLILTMPCLPGQFSAAELDEVIGLPVPHQGIKPMMPVMKSGNGDVPPEVQVSSIVERVRGMLAEAKVVLPERTSMEISHPKGLKNFDQEGAVLIDVVNREYCKKIIIQLPGQNHPSHKHIQKEETFHLLAGELEIDVDDQVTVLKAGDSLTIQRGKMHGFRTPTGMILEEISTTHIKGDSLYEDGKIPSDPTTRKTPAVL
jgi:sialic acid synthase SpsE/quercetin dioxygenase-like cupin family protein